MDLVSIMSNEKRKIAPDGAPAEASAEVSEDEPTFVAAGEASRRPEQVKSDGCCPVLQF